jgi:osmotically-inducible protein OsmY
MADGARHIMTFEENKITDDRSIRANVLADLEKFSSQCTSLINVVVLHGIVQLWGVLTDESQRNTILTATERIAGVKSVEDHLMLVQPTAFAALMS